MCAEIGCRVAHYYIPRAHIKKAERDRRTVRVIALQSLGDEFGLWFLPSLTS